MDKLRLVPNEMSDNNQAQDYSEIKLDLEKRLAFARSESELSDLASFVAKIFQNETLTPKEKNDLKNFRQKIYDYKKKFKKLVVSATANNKDPFLQNSQTQYSTCAQCHRAEKIDQKIESNPVSNLRFVKKDNYYGIIVNLLTSFLFSACAFLTMWFIWKQSIPLYESIGFTDPKFVAFGAILMIVSFSMIHGITKSKLLLLLCIYISGYEVAMMINGTIKHEVVQAESRIDGNQELLWLIERATQSGQDYQAIKAKYDDATLKVYQNSWFKMKYVDPAWEKYLSDQDKVSKKKEQLMFSHANNNHQITVLKILYRLGLVFLCMVSIHQFLKSFSRLMQNVRLTA